jgi:hypothetical protein
VDLTVRRLQVVAVLAAAGAVVDELWVEHMKEPASYTLAEEYFRTLRAPLKGFYRFDGAAHSPILEQPDLAREFLRTDVLAGTNRRSTLK